MTVVVTSLSNQSSAADFLERDFWTIITRQAPGAPVLVRLSGQEIVFNRTYLVGTRRLSSSNQVWMR